MSIYDYSGKVITPDMNIAEPDDSDIPVVTLTGQLYETKAQGYSNITVGYKSNSLCFSDYGQARVQGDSSQYYPKKNYTIKIYTNSARTQKSKRLFKDWDKARSKFVLKANWIDHSHARNIVNARLWTQIMKTRDDFESLPQALLKGNMAIDGFPVKVYHNGVYQGLYTWNLPKDAMYGLDSDIDENCIMQSDGDPNSSGLSMYFKSYDMSEGKWSDELHDSMPSIIRTNWTSVLRFVYESSDSDFKANINNYIDLQSLIDVHIFIQVCCLRDQIGKNQTFYTYDASKWYHGMYDMDGSWGLKPIETATGWHKYNTIFQDEYIGYAYSNGNRLHERLTSLFLTEITGRYQYLRSNVLSEDNVIAEFDRFTSVIPPYLYAEDYAETTGGGNYTEIPRPEDNNILQIREFVPKRLAYIDANLK